MLNDLSCIIWGTPRHPDRKTSMSELFCFETPSVTSPTTCSFDQVLTPERSQVTMARRRRGAEVAAIRWDNKREEQLRKQYPLPV